MSKRAARASLPLVLLLALAAADPSLAQEFPVAVAARMQQLRALGIDAALQLQAGDPAGRDYYLEACADQTCIGMSAAATEAQRLFDAMCLHAYLDASGPERAAPRFRAAVRDVGLRRGVVLDPDDSAALRHALRTLAQDFGLWTIAYDEGVHRDSLTLDQLLGEADGE